MNLNHGMKTCEEYQQATNELWRRLLPLAGPRALRIFVVRCIFESVDAVPWLRHIRFHGDGRPDWGSVAESPRRQLILRSIVVEILSAVAVKTVEQFGDLPQRPSGLRR